MENILKYWAIGTLILSGLNIFKFINLSMYGTVNYLQNTLILIVELLLTLFVFGLSIYLVYQVMFGKKALNIDDLQEIQAV